MKLEEPLHPLPRLQAIFEANKGEIAGLILEPVVGNSGFIPPTKEFLEGLRELCTQVRATPHMPCRAGPAPAARCTPAGGGAWPHGPAHARCPHSLPAWHYPPHPLTHPTHTTTTLPQEGAVLCFDEVMTGFRIAKGCAQVGIQGGTPVRGGLQRLRWPLHAQANGACQAVVPRCQPRLTPSAPHSRARPPQEHFGVTPDLTTMGKVIGGGLPVGAYGGKKEIMQMVAPAGPMYQASRQGPRSWGGRGQQRSAGHGPVGAVCQKQGWADGQDRQRQQGAGPAELQRGKGLGRRPTQLTPPPVPRVPPSPPVAQAGTLSGNPLAMVAGIKTLEILGRPGAYEHLDKITKRWVPPGGWVGRLLTARLGGPTRLRHLLEQHIKSAAVLCVWACRKQRSCRGLDLSTSMPMIRATSTPASPLLPPRLPPPPSPPPA